VPGPDHPGWSKWTERSVGNHLARYGVQLCLHHYATPAAFASIVSTRTIWATDARFMNDADELRYGLELCYRALDEEVREPRLAPHVQALRERLAGRYGYSTFIACFSERNDVPSQWKRYADNGKGFAVGFDNACLSALDFGGVSPRQMRVEYVAEAQKARAVEAVRNTLADICSLGGNAASEFDVQSAFVFLAVELFSLCSTFKTAKWSSECEWRVLYFRDNDVPVGLPLRQRFNPDGISVPYVALDLTSMRVRNPIFDCVRAGWQVTDDQVAEAMSRFERETPSPAWSRQGAPDDASI